jgi:dUTP pyrophosphatase
VLSFTNIQKQGILQELKDLLMPRFTAESAEWLPQCAHAKDAAADIKAWIPQHKTEAELKDELKKLQLFTPKEEIYVNGKPLKDNSLLSALKVEDGYAFVLLPPGERRVIKAGFKIALPELPDPFTACYRISSRSGLAAKHGIFVTNSPGLIDCYYRDDVGVILENQGKSTHFFGHGARIAQGAYEILIAQSSWTPEEVLEECLDETIRKGGFGHTGV